MHRAGLSVTCQSADTAAASRSSHRRASHHVTASAEAPTVALPTLAWMGRASLFHLLCVKCVCVCEQCVGE